MSTRLTDAMWLEIKDAYRAGTSAKKLAQRYKIQPGTIHTRSCKEKWRYFDMPAVGADMPAVERLEALAGRLENVARVLLAERERK